MPLAYAALPSIAQMPSNTIKSNLTGGTAPPVDNTLFNVREALLNNITTAGGSLIYKGGSNWSGIIPGTTGQVLTMASPTVPAWQTPVSTPPLTGEVTTSGSTATISANAVTNTKQAPMPPNTIKGNDNPGPGNTNPTDLTATQVKTLLGLGALATLNSVNLSTQATGTLQVGQAGALSGDVTSTAGSITTTISANVVTNGKLFPMPALTLKANITGATNNTTDVSTSQLLDATLGNAIGSFPLRNASTWNAAGPGPSGFVLTSQGVGANLTWAAVSQPTLTGDVTTAGSVATIAPNMVTNAKAAPMPPNTIKGNNTGATTNPIDLDATQVKTLLGLGTVAVLNSVDLSTAQATGTLAATRFGILTGDVTNGLTGGSYSTTIAPGVVDNGKLAQMTTGTIKSNLTGGTAPPVDNALATVRDALLNTMSTNTAGSLVYKGAGNWSGIGPGAVGQVLTTTSLTSLAWQTPVSTPSPLSSITAGTAINTINSTNFAQTWNWSTASTQNPLTLTAPALTTGSLLTLTSAADSIGLSCNGRLLTAVGVTAITNTTPVQTTGTTNNFMENKIKNASTGASAQSGFTAENDTGTATSGFAWMGINNSAFANPQTYNAGVAGDVTYVGSGQDLIIANANQTKAIKFQTGKTAPPYFDDRMTILNNGFVGINTITPLSHLDVNGSFSSAYRTDANAAVTFLATDSIVALTFNGAQTVTLPSPAVAPRRILTIINNTSVQKSFVTPGFPIVIYGPASVLIPPYSTITLQSDGVLWKSIQSTGWKKPSFKVYRGGALSIPNGTATIIPYDTPEFDVSNGGLGSGQVASGVFTCSVPGIYTFSAGVNLNVTATMLGDSYIEIFNQTTGVSTRAGMFLTGTSGSGQYYGTISTDFDLALNNTVVVRVTQNSGSARNIGFGQALTWFCGRLTH
jgi:hypothetical protein